MEPVRLFGSITHLQHAMRIVVVGFEGNFVNRRGFSALTNSLTMLPRATPVYATTLRAGDIGAVQGLRPNCLLFA